jgi:hypothetical protein
LNIKDSSQGRDAANYNGSYATIRDNANAIANVICIGDIYNFDWYQSPASNISTKLLIA